MNRIVRRAAIFAAASLVWWMAACWIVLMAAIGPCGMGPDATCEPSMLPFWLAIGGAVFGYAGLAALLIRLLGRSA